MRVGGFVPEDGQLRSAYEAEQRRRARASTLVLGAIGIVVFPAWALFDVLLLPDLAASFLTVRLVVTAAMAVACLLLWWRPTGRRWPEQLAFVAVALPEVSIAWMIPQTGAHLEPYLLGLSIAIWASAFLLDWRWPLTALLVVVTGMATAGFVAASDEPVGSAEVATIAFYLTTSGAFAVALQAYRQRSAWNQFVTREALEAERRRNEALLVELEQLSRVDALTGVGNRRAWEERLVGEFLRARRAGTTMSVVICDFDRFKDVNDAHGHPAGDAVLRHGARMLQERARATDFVARLGGDEFAIVCPGVGLDDAEHLATSFAELARSSAFPAGVAMTFSLGVAELHPDDREAADLLQRADAALYRAKAARDCVAVLKA